MKKYLIGYKQGNGAYVYVNSINDYSISVTINTDNAIEFFSEKIATNLCEFLNLKNKEQTYLPLMVTIDVEEVVIDVITD